MYHTAYDKSFMVGTRRLKHLWRGPGSRPETGQGQMTGREACRESSAQWYRAGRGGSSRVVLVGAGALPSPVPQGSDVLSSDL